MGNRLYCLIQSLCEETEKISARVNGPEEASSSSTRRRLLHAQSEADKVSAFSLAVAKRARV